MDEHSQERHERPEFPSLLCYYFVMIARRSALLGLCSWLAGPLHARAAEPTPAVAGLASVPDVAFEPEMLRLRDALAREVQHLVPRTAASDAMWVGVGARISSSFSSSLSAVKDAFEGQIGTDRIGTSAICLLVARSYHLGLMHVERKWLQLLRSLPELSSRSVHQRHARPKHQLEVFSTDTPERRHAQAGHPVQHRAGDLGLGFLGRKRPGAQATADDDLVAEHGGFRVRPPAVADRLLPS